MVEYEVQKMAPAAGFEPATKWLTATRNYEDQNGQKRYITEVVVDEAEFVESGNGQGADQAYHEAPASRPAPAPSFAPPPAGSAASDAPLAPKTQIEPSGDPGFGPGDQVDLPFEI